jgi:hypothetical protein
VNKLHDALAAAIDAVKVLGGVVDDDTIGAVKTYNFYLRVIDRLVRQLYSGEIGEAQFTDALFDTMDEQLSRAWREGMRTAGKNPETDFTAQMQSQLQTIKLNELVRIENFAADVVRNRRDDDFEERPGHSLTGLRARGELWADRYNEVVNEAVIASSDPTDRLVWRLGATEEHCATCAALDGWVQTADWWDKFGVFPQNPPNPALECGGWRCECRLSPTNEPVSEGMPF